MTDKKFLETSPKFLTQQASVRTKENIQGKEKFYLGKYRTAKLNSKGKLTFRKRKRKIHENYLAELVGSIHLFLVSSFPSPKDFGG